MLRAIRVDDFTGGLNLDSNSFQVAKNQSGDLLNVDLNPKGGVSSRWGFARKHTSAIGGLAAGAFIPSKLFAWSAAGNKYLLLAANDAIYHSTGGDFTSLSASTDNDFGASFTNWNREDDSLLYIARGSSYQTSKWDGTTLTTLTASGTGAWQNDLTNPNGTHAPKGEHIATHVDRLWVAGTTENGATYPNRVRFSHPLFPESWREDDYIDVAGGGPKITAIVPFGGHLLVFKQSSVWAVYGYSEDTFQLVELTSRLGAVNPNAVAVADRGVYFFSNPDGVFMYDGRGFSDIFQNIRPLAIGSEINESVVSAITLGWANRRVYLSLPSGEDATSATIYDSTTVTYDDEERKYGGATRATRPTINFVYDESVGKGAWTAYKTADGYGLVTPTDFTDVNGGVFHLAVHPYQPYVLSIDKRENGAVDNITGTNAGFESYYVTGWQDADNVSARKFWRRPEFVMRQETDGTSLSVEVYHDWRARELIKTFTITQVGEEVGAESWQSWLDPDFGATHSKADSLGVARSVQLKLKGNQSDGWAVYSLTYKFNPRKIQA
jgi:hypothetical protein